MSPFLGGDKRVRTADPLLAKQVLSQLSYTPFFPLRLREPQKLNNESLSPFSTDLSVLTWKSLASRLFSLERR